MPSKRAVKDTADIEIPEVAKWDPELTKKSRRHPAADGQALLPL